MKTRGRTLSLALLIVVCACAVRAADFPDLVGRHPLGINQAVATEGNLAFVGNGAALQVVDLSSPATPEIIGRLDLPTSIYEIAVSNGHVYAMTERAIYSIDVTNPSSPMEVGSFDGFGYSLAASGTTVWYLPGGYMTPGPTISQFLRVVDFSIPAAPLAVNKWWTDRYVAGVEVVGRFALLPSYDELLILDVSPSSDSIEVGRVNLGYGFDSESIDVVGTLAYVGAYRALTIVDWSSPDEPVVVGGLDLPDGADGIAVHGDLAYVASSSSGLHVVDVSNPTAPRWLGSTLPQDWSWGESVAAIAGHGLVATAYHGVRVVAATDPTDPTEIARIEAPGISQGVDDSDGVLAIAAHERGLRLVDVSDAGAPEELSILNLGGLVQAVAAVDEMVYTVGSSMSVIDIADPLHPVVIGEAPAVQGTDIKVIDQLAYVVASGGLKVIDVTDPTSPTVIGDLGLDLIWRGIDVLGTVAVLAGSGGYAIIDISNPTDPIQVASLPASGLYKGLALHESLLLSGGQGTYPERAILRIHDLSDPSNPVELSTLSFPANWIRTIGVSGSVAYVGTNALGSDERTEVLAVDIGDPTAPVVVASSEIFNGMTDLALSDEHVFVTRNTSGFDTFALYQGSIFADDFETNGTTAWSITVP